MARAQQIDPNNYAGMLWRSIGPFRGGRALAVAGVPSEPSVFYFGSVDGGVWKSGSQVRPAFSVFGGVTVDPGNPDIVWVPDIALYRSDDGGRDFSAVEGAPGGDDYHVLWIDADNTTHMVLGSDQGAIISLVADPGYGKA